MRVWHTHYTRLYKWFYVNDKMTFFAPTYHVRARDLCSIDYVTYAIHAVLCDLCYTSLYASLDYVAQRHKTMTYAARATYWQLSLTMTHAAVLRIVILHQPYACAIVSIHAICYAKPLRITIRHARAPRVTRHITHTPSYSHTLTTIHADSQACIIYRCNKIR